MQDFISLGAGVQSTTMLLMAAHGEIEFNGKYAIFSDTGWEPKHVYDHLLWLQKEAKKFDIEVVVTSNGNILEDTKKAVQLQTRVASMPFFTLDEKGEKGIIMRQCTSEYKIIPVQRSLRKALGYKPRMRIKENINLWMGISTDEIQRVKPSRMGWITHQFPLIDNGMNRQDCLMWMERKGYPLPPKSSCVGCPYHSNETWKEIKQKYPDEWKVAVELDQAIRDGMPKIKGQAFLHRSCKALDEVDLNEDQISFYDDDFINECEGMCGV